MRSVYKKIQKCTRFRAVWCPHAKREAHQATLLHQGCFVLCHSVSCQTAQDCHLNTTSCVAACLSFPTPSEKLVIPVLGSLSALSEVSKALGGCEGVRLQREEVLLWQEERSTLWGVWRVWGVWGLMELQLCVGGRVLNASWQGWRCVRGRWWWR